MFKTLWPFNRSESIRVGYLALLFSLTMLPLQVLQLHSRTSIVFFFGADNVFFQNLEVFVKYLLPAFVTMTTATNFILMFPGDLISYGAALLVSFLIWYILTNPLVEGVAKSNPKLLNS